MAYYFFFIIPGGTQIGVFIYTKNCKEHKCHTWDDDNAWLGVWKIENNRRHHNPALPRSLFCNKTSSCLALNLTMPRIKVEGRVESPEGLGMQQRNAQREEKAGWFWTKQLCNQGGGRTEIAKDKDFFCFLLFYCKKKKKILPRALQTKACFASENN